MIGAPVNLAAKLEKHNKLLGSRAVTTAEAYDAALAQGYQPPGDPVRQTSQVEGIDDPVEIVVLHQ